MREAARARANRGQGPTLPISEPDIGKNVANAATSGANAAHADADLIFGRMSETAGRNTPIDDSIVQRTLDNLRRICSAVAQPTIDYYQNLLDAERQRGGLTWDAALEHRALARPSDSALSFDKNTHDAIAAVNDALPQSRRVRAASIALRSSTPSTPSMAVSNKSNKSSTTSAKRKPRLPTAKVFSPGRTPGAKTSISCGAHGGDANSLANILSQNFELKTRTRPSGGWPRLSRLPDAKLYPGGPKWWADASEETRQAYANNPGIALATGSTRP